MLILPTSYILGLGEREELPYKPSTVEHLTWSATFGYNLTGSNKREGLFCGSNTTMEFPSTLKNYALPVNVQVGKIFYYNLAF